MKTMLDKCAVAGDITQAIDRRGAWTCAIVIAGGTESTAVKLQSCATDDGTFEDFKILIPASEAETDQYKGFVIDLDGAKKFIKITGATMATCVLGDCDVDVKQVAIKAGEIPSGADLENNKTATIDVSTYTEPVEVTPTAGKDGMKKATVKLSNIPSGGATAYAWVDQTLSIIIYFVNFSIAPDSVEGFKLYSKSNKTISNVDFSSYVKVDDSTFSITDPILGKTTTVVRDSSKDEILSINDVWS